MDEDRGQEKFRSDAHSDASVALPTRIRRVGNVTHHDRHAVEEACPIDIARRVYVQARREDDGGDEPEE